MITGKSILAMYPKDEESEKPKQSTDRFITAKHLRIVKGVIESRDSITYQNLIVASGLNRTYVSRITKALVESGDINCRRGKGDSAGVKVFTGKGLSC